MRPEENWLGSRPSSGAMLSRRFRLEKPRGNRRKTTRAVGEHAGAKPTWGPARHSATEDQLHPIGSSEIDILTNDLLEKDASGLWTIEHLGE